LYVNAISRTSPEPEIEARFFVEPQNGGTTHIDSEFAGSHWAAPTTPADPIVFFMDNVDPLEIIDFHVMASGYLVTGEIEPSNPAVTATLRLFENDVLISQRDVQTHNCCYPGTGLAPLVGTYPPNAIPPTIHFAPDSALTSSYRRVMNRAQTYGGYPSPYQQRLIGSPSVPDLGGVIEVEITLIGANGGPAEGVDVYAKVTDPPDPAPYRSDRKSGDNKDSPGVATISGAPGYEVQVPGSTATVLRSDAGGKIFSRLHGSTREAGDNYRLRVSLYRPVLDTEPCSPNNMRAPCFESDVFTIWKRAVVENDRMIKDGTFLARGYTGGTQVQVVSTKTFKPSAGATLIFMHASRGPEGFYWETRSIASYKNGVITLAQPLSRTYDGPAVNRPAHTSDSVGLWGAGFYDVSLDPLRDSFSDAFIDIQELPQTMPYFPYVDKMTAAMMTELSTLWREGPANVHLIAAHYYSGSSFGTSNADVSCVWVQQCIDYTSNADPLRNEIAAHEVVHRWDVNITAGRLSDHCDLNAYPDTSKRCTMHAYIQQSSTQQGSPVRAEFRDGVVQFHYVIIGSTADSEYLGLRSKDGIQ
jgi:hypothetical protein